MKLLLLPLAVMCVVSLLSVTGLGTGDLSADQSLYYNYNSYADGGTDQYLYDEFGHSVCDYDLNPTGENGELVPYHRAGQFLDLTQWKNDTGYYFVFDEEDDAVTFDSLVAGWSISDQTGYDDVDTRTYLVSGSLGVLTLIGVIMGLGALVGIRFFGMGESETSVKLLLICTFFTSVWLIFSGINYQIFFLSGQMFMFILYFVLSLMYATGMILTFSGGDD